MKRFLRASVLGILFVGVTSTLASQRAIILSDLSVEPIARILTLSDQTIEVETPEGSIRVLSTAQAVALTQISPRTVRPVEGAGWIELVDGQRIVGQSAELASDAEFLAWRHRDFGVIAVSLDRVTRLSPPGAPMIGDGISSTQRVNDTVYLGNGDVIEGFLLEASDEVVVERDDGGTTTTPMSRVALITLANVPVSPEGMYLWLVDGSVFFARSIIDVTGERVQVELISGESAVLKVSQVLGVVFRSENTAPLSGTAITGDEFPMIRRWSHASTSYPSRESIHRPLLFAGDIVVPGPMTLRWTLKKNATRFGARIVMPTEAFPWGDCEVVVRSGGKEIFRERLNEHTPAFDISVSLNSRLLEIEVLASEFGPIYDLIRIEAPLVLLGED